MEEKYANCWMGGAESQNILEWEEMVELCSEILNLHKSYQRIGWANQS